MASKVGKTFEEQFAKSVPGYALVDRRPDPAQAFDKDQDRKKTRFSRKNPFDYQIWDPKRRILFALELKTVAGKSISFERSKDEKGEIHYHQIEGLSKWSQYDGIIAGFVIEFRSLETTVFINIEDFTRLMDVIPKKSFSYNDLSLYSIDYTIIPQTKKRTLYSYDVEGFIDAIKE